MTRRLVAVLALCARCRAGAVGGVDGRQLDQLSALLEKALDHWRGPSIAAAPRRAAVTASYSYAYDNNDGVDGPEPTPEPSRTSSSFSYDLTAAPTYAPTPVLGAPTPRPTALPTPSPAPSYAPTPAPLDVTVRASLEFEFAAEGENATSLTKTPGLVDSIIEAIVDALEDLDVRRRDVENVELSDKEAAARRRLLAEGDTVVAAFDILQNATVANLAAAGALATRFLVAVRASMTTALDSGTFEEAFEAALATRGMSITLAVAIDASLALVAMSTVVVTVDDDDGPVPKKKKSSRSKSRTTILVLLLVVVLFLCLSGGLTVGFTFFCVQAEDESPPAKIQPEGFFATVPPARASER